ncbi:MAG: saccharopine dehydrogenase NADP-binding domain-containing protein [Bacteroidales bacterium]|jgi:saccharopine dehydrogenase-like NADP-dependent oxidoreductase
MKALLLGCGEIGKEALRDLFNYGCFEEIIVGTRTISGAESFIASLNGSSTIIRHVSIDISDIDAVADLMKGCVVAVNCAGPNFKYELPVAYAAIKARVPLVDINDEYEITFKMYDLNESAKEAGIPIIFGLGGAPGIDNVLVRAAADQLDEIDEIHTSWIMSGADPGGHALSQHLLYSLAGKGYTVEDGILKEIRSFVDGGEMVEYPEPIGKVKVFHIGHPEPITLSRTFPSAKIINNKATFIPNQINNDILELGQRIRQSDGSISTNKAWGDEMNLAATALLERCRKLENVPLEAGLMVRLKGSKRGRAKKIVFSSVGRLGPATGIPASIGAIMIAQGKINLTGAMPPEKGIDAHDFLYEILDRRNLAKLNGWVED